MIERKFVSEGIINVQIRKYLEQRLARANVVNVDLQKTALVSRVAITAEKPGMIIGKKGSSIESLTKALEQKFGLTQPQIEVKALENPDLNGTVVANRIAEQLERRGQYKPLLVKAIQAIMQAGAQGCEVVIKGALIGKGGKALKVSKIEGYVKKVGDMTKLVSLGKAVAKTKKGTIGVQVRILPPTAVFVDKEDITKFLPKEGELAVPLAKAAQPAIVPAKEEASAPTQAEEKVLQELKEPAAEEKPKAKKGKKAEPKEEKAETPEAPEEKEEKPKAKKVKAEKSEAKDSKEKKPKASKKKE